MALAKSTYAANASKIHEIMSAMDLPEGWKWNRIGQEAATREGGIWAVVEVEASSYLGWANCRAGYAGRTRRVKIENLRGKVPELIQMATELGEKAAQIEERRKQRITDTQEATQAAAECGVDPLSDYDLRVFNCAAKLQLELRRKEGETPQEFGYRVARWTRQVRAMDGS